MFKSVTLEVSLKPFKRTDDEYIRSVCAQIFDQWRALTRNRETVSIMMWVGDGSEILDYAGSLNDEFEWCRFVGTANLEYLKEGEPRELSLHKRKQDYMENAPKMTYGILKKIVSTLKEECVKRNPGVRVRVGETFDIGPEFAISEFKYKRHLEISTGHSLDKFGFVDATARLNADTRRYAAYPNGIPQGEPFGTFLGKQSREFLRDLGFDYLWLSNGLGFSADPWDKTGKIFDGEKYYPEKLADTKAKVFEFWKLFRAACPDFPLETRGTNNSVGIDYASDGVPLYDIYNANLDITAPPNSPWAALNDNYGLEIMGHMTRICELPNSNFPFRYYIHDPWWINSPWYDRYDGSPCDIYLPMAISRITADGKIESANTLNLLSIDNSYGTMPDACVNEPLPHLLKAEKDCADSPAPVVWVYPMREYTTSDSPQLLREMNLGDNFICDAINDGFPLCCVTSTDSFLKHDLSVYARSAILSPVPENPAVGEKLSELGKQGVSVIMYGTKERLEEVADFENLTKLCSEDAPSKLRVALAALGYEITFNKKSPAVKPPTMAIVRRDNALFFSVYNSNTTTDTVMKFPHGAPILCGCETEIKDGYSFYRFIRGEHRECRIFIDQKDGVISCRECNPGNARYRRKIILRGLKDATVTAFPEYSCEIAATYVNITDKTPVYNTPMQLEKDPTDGYMLRGEHVSGELIILIGHKNTLCD